MAIECKHGQLARSCDICMLEAELAEVTAQRDKLQELINAPEVEPVARVTGYYGGYLSIATVDGRILPAGTALYLAPPAPSVPDELSGRFTDPAKLAADLPTWENGEDPLVCGGLISRGIVDFATVGIWPTKPAQSVPDGWRSAIAKEFPLYDEDGLDEDKHCCEWVMLQERKRLHKMLAAPTPAEAPADVARDSVASEPVGYLYTNLQSGEYHVSDADDDYRGPERVLWCIEPVYRRAKGQQA